MSRSYFIELAEKGLAMPLAVDLLVHRLSSAEKVDEDVSEMARIMAEAARQFRTPLAVAPMDLRVEKAFFGELLGIATGKRATHHIDDPLDSALFLRLKETLQAGRLSGRMEITCSALTEIARKGEHLPVGMLIGPFSFVTKLMNDAITAVYMLGQGLEPGDDESVALFCQLLELTTLISSNYARAQVKAGAKAIIVCEPAANKVYISPNQMEDGSDIFERVVLKPNAVLKQAIEDGGADLILHDCGELTDAMISALASLRPSMLSLGSCVDLPSAAPLIDKDVVLFGNIPSKFFPRDEELPVDRVRAMCEDLMLRMKALGHPHILGSECDVLSVPGKEASILAKSEVIASFSVYTG